MFLVLGIVDVFFSFYARVTSFPLIIQICIIFILASIVLSSLFFSYISLDFLFATRKKKNVERLTPIIDELILKYLFDNETDYNPYIIREDLEKELGKLNKFNTQLIIDRLISLKNNFDLDSSSSKNLNNLISAAEIEKFISGKLAFSSDFEKMKGIQELSSLAITASESNIFPFTYATNDNIRKEARTSYMRLSKNDPFKFFDESKEQLNTWDQINLLKHLMGIDSRIIPTFSKWIAYSNNESVVEFCIKMCAYFKQKDSIPVLIEFLKTPNHLLRAEAIKALGELDAKIIEDYLIEFYTNQPENCQIEIIRAIGKFQTGNSIDFLHHSFENAITVETRKVAAEAIYNYGEIGRELYYALEEASESDVTLVLKHIENPLIKFK